MFYLDHLNDIAVNPGRLAWIPFHPSHFWLAGWHRGGRLHTHVGGASSCRAPSSHRQGKSAMKGPGILLHWTHNFIFRALLPLTMEDNYLFNVFGGGKEATVAGDGSNYYRLAVGWGRLVHRVLVAVSFSRRSTDDDTAQLALGCTVGSYF